MVDEVLNDTASTQKRLRKIPARVVVYLLLAAGLFPCCGWLGVWRKLTAGLGCVAQPVASALFYARRRVGVAPMRALFRLLAQPGTAVARWRGLVVCALDGTSVTVADTAVNRAAFGRRRDNQMGAGGYPHARLVALVACGSRMLLGAVFGTYARGESTWARDLVEVMGPGQLVVADRGFAVADLIERIAATGAQVLVRVKDNRRLPAVKRLPDGTSIVVVGGIRVRLVEARLTITSPAGRRTSAYRLITTLTDAHHYPASDIMAVYHQRWEIETAYGELKSGLLTGRVLRARDPAGVDQEMWSLLCLYQALRTAIDNAVTGTGLTPLQTRFTLARETARDQLIRAAGIIADETTDLKGRIGRSILDNPQPARRQRTAPRVTKRALSKHRAQGHINHHTYQTHLDTTITASP